MLKKLLGRHRVLRLGATIVGASALAVGFASPAFAAQSVNNGNGGNTNADNYLIVQGGSNTAYLMMQAEADIFNQAPGCDLVGAGGTDAQPLDYGCPGYTDSQGVVASSATVTTFTGVSVTNAFKTIHLTGTAAQISALAIGNQLTDSGTGGGNVIPQADPIKTLVVQSTTTAKVKLAFAPTGTDASDSIVVNTNAQQGENGYAQWGAENPFNDVAVEEASYGSGNGIGELEATGGSHSASLVNPDTETTNPSGVNVSPIDSARSSAAPNLGAYSAGGNYQGLNFVAYGMDAVSFLTWNKFDGVTTDASQCLATIGAGNVSSATILNEIFNETYSGGQPTLTWHGLDSACTSTNPVYAYWAQSGSGTQKTWASVTGASSSGFPQKQVIFENETSAILANSDGSTAATINGTGTNGHTPIGDVIFFFSYGAFSHKCAPNLTTSSTSYLSSTDVNCAGTSTVPTTPNSVQLGTEINGIQVNPTTIQDQLPGFTGGFKGDRLIYNVYSDGENSTNIPTTNAATLNFVSEDGFLCKPATNTDVNPNDGNTYRADIDTALEGQGFLPIPLTVENGQNATTGNYFTTAQPTGIPHPAWSVLSGSAYGPTAEATLGFPAADIDTDYTAVQGTYANVLLDGATAPSVTASASSPVGYCITETTDGATNQ